MCPLIKVNQRLLRPFAGVALGNGFFVIIDIMLIFDHNHFGRKQWSAAIDWLSANDHKGIILIDTVIAALGTMTQDSIKVFPLSRCF